MFLPLLFLLAFPHQSSPVSTPPDALTLLNDVTQKYAEASSYRIEATQERTYSNELSRQWEKTLMTAIVGPDGRYHYEARGSHGSAILVSDGTTKWTYHVNEQLYTQKAVADFTSSPQRYIPPGEMAIQEAKSAMTGLRSMALHLKSARFLADEKLELNGKTVDCFVVRYTEADFRKPHKIKTEHTVWIDKSRRVVVKETSLSDSYSVTPGSEAHIPLKVESTTTYSVVELAPQPESAFKFVPPDGVKLMASFPDPFAGQRFEVKTSELVGKSAPDVELKSADGRVTSLSEFRGKPVLIDFWATSCMPCVDLMPYLKTLYSTTQSKGLVWISVDDDEDPVAAAKFVINEKIPWSNYHDAGPIGRAFHREGIPLGVLIGADGIIKFYGEGYEIGELQAAIARLGPEFSAVASEKPK